MSDEGQTHFYGDGCDPPHVCSRCGGQGFLYMPEDDIACPECGSADQQGGDG